MTYEYLNDNDLGFKILDNGNHPDQMERLNQLPYIFKRSDIEKAMKARPPQTLYLRSTKRKEDYEMKFLSTENLRSFLELFPERINDESRTVNYYFMPYQSNNPQ